MFGPDPNVYFANLIMLSIVAAPVLLSIKSLAGRHWVAVALGIYIHYTVAPLLILFWPLYWIGIWGATRMFDRLRGSWVEGYFVAVVIGAALAPMLLWKLTPDQWFAIMDRLGAMTARVLPVLRESGAAEVVPILLPLGLSFTAFRGVDFLVGHFVGVYSGTRLRETFFYGFFAPVAGVGPIVQFSELQRRAYSDAPNPWAWIAEGMLRIAIGLVKIYVFARMASPATELLSNFGERSTAELWLGMFAYSWYLYFNFAGFSDMAIGLGLLYGYRLQENFSFPYFRPNLQQFWAHWHISLTGFAQRNIFVPLGGYRRGRQYGAILATMMVIALWHDISVALLVFGLLHGSGLVLLRLKDERYPQPAPAARTRQIAATLATYIFVMMTIPLLNLRADEIAPFYAAVLGLR